MPDFSASLPGRAVNPITDMQHLQMASSMGGMPLQRATGMIAARYGDMPSFVSAYARQAGLDPATVEARLTGKQPTSWQGGMGEDQTSPGNPAKMAQMGQMAETGSMRPMAGGGLMSSLFGYPEDDKSDPGPSGGFDPRYDARPGPAHQAPFDPRYDAQAAPKLPPFDPRYDAPAGLSRLAPFDPRYDALPKRAGGLARLADGGDPGDDDPSTTDPYAWMGTTLREATKPAAEQRPQQEPESPKLGPTDINGITGLYRAIFGHPNQPMPNELELAHQEQQPPPPPVDRSQDGPTDINGITGLYRSIFGHPNQPMPNEVELAHQEQRPPPEREAPKFDPTDPTTDGYAQMGEAAHDAGQNGLLSKIFPPTPDVSPLEIQRQTQEVTQNDPYSWMGPAAQDLGREGADWFRSHLPSGEAAAADTNDSRASPRPGGEWGHAPPPVQENVAQLPPTIGPPEGLPPAPPPAMAPLVDDGPSDAPANTAPPERLPDIPQDIAQMPLPPDTPPAPPPARDEAPTPVDGVSGDRVGPATAAPTGGLPDAGAKPSPAAEQPAAKPQQQSGSRFLDPRFQMLAGMAAGLLGAGRRPNETASTAFARAMGEGLQGGMHGATSAENIAAERQMAQSRLSMEGQHLGIQQQQANTQMQRADSYDKYVMSRDKMYDAQEKLRLAQADKLDDPTNRALNNQLLQARIAAEQAQAEHSRAAAGAVHESGPAAQAKVYHDLITRSQAGDQVAKQTLDAMTTAKAPSQAAQDLAHERNNITLNLGTDRNTNAEQANQIRQQLGEQTNQIRQTIGQQANQVRQQAVDQRSANQGQAQERLTRDDARKALANDASYMMAAPSKKKSMEEEYLNGTPPAAASPASNDPLGIR